MNLLGGGAVTDAQQSFSFTRRSLVLGGAQLALGGVLAARMGWLAIAENERYALLAESNRVNLTLVPPRRGWIVDRYGQPIATNRADFRVDVIPDRMRDREATLTALQALLALPPEEMARIRTDLADGEGYRPIQIAANLDWERYAAVTVRQAALPGVVTERGWSRHYPDGAAVGHLIGYVGAASAKQYQESKDPLLITPGFKIGKDGLEKTMEPALRGEPGAKRVEVTAGGRPVRELADRPDVAGRQLRTTIDAGLQLYAARRLGDNSGSVVVIDLARGDILALASMPAYDPNSFSDGISHDEWDMLSGDERIPLMNKVLQGLYPPGSTFKPATALAALAAGVDAEHIVNCPGGYQLGNRRFACLGRHGPMNMHRAIARSCNTYFYSTGRAIGIARIAEAARALGLGAEFPLPVPTQRYGTVPDEAWKRRRHDQAWSQSDTLNTSIGQGYLQVSPLQLAVMSARIASGRVLMPQLVAGRAEPGSALSFPEPHLAVVRAGMSEVVNGAGTAVRSRLPLEGVQMAGKTGTAQVRRIAGGARGGVNVPWKYRDHGLFICFAPVDAPRYAAAVVIEHGMSGSGAAAPVARDTLTYLFDPPKAMAALSTLEQGWGGDIRTRMAAHATAWKAAKALEAGAPATAEGLSG